MKWKWKEHCSGNNSVDNFFMLQLLLLPALLLLSLSPFFIIISCTILLFQLWGVCALSTHAHTYWTLFFYFFKRKLLPIAFLQSANVNVKVNGKGLKKIWASERTSESRSSGSSRRRFTMRITLKVFSFNVFICKYLRFTWGRTTMEGFKHIQFLRMPYFILFFFLEFIIELVKW